MTGLACSGLVWISGNFFRRQCWVLGSSTRVMTPDLNLWVIWRALVWSARSDHRRPHKARPSEAQKGQTRPQRLHHQIRLSRHQGQAAPGCPDQVKSGWTMLDQHSQRDHEKTRSDHQRPQKARPNDRGYTTTPDHPDIKAMQAAPDCPDKVIPGRTMRSTAFSTKSRKDLIRPSEAP